jgi:putative membrane protein
VDEVGADGGPGVAAGGRGDPDSRARTHLANERTFLAWLRTGLGLIVVGLGAAQFLERDRELGAGVSVVSAFAVFLALAGTATVAIGAVHYVQGRERIEAERFRPAGWSVTVVAALVVLGGLLAVGLVLWLDGG